MVTRQPKRRRGRPSQSQSQPREVELDLDGITHGGEAVGRLPEGKACFVPFAIPGERVRVRVVEERRRWARGELLEVLVPSPDRVEAPCALFGPGGCGGCQLQHVAPERQTALRRRVLIEQLERIGGISDPPVTAAVRCGDEAYRTRARFAVTRDGRLGFRRAGSHDVVPVARCHLATADLQALRERMGDGWAGVGEVTLRTGSAGSAAVVTPGPDALPPLPATADDVALLDATGTAVGLRGDGVLTEVVDGFGFRVSPTSFFQANRCGAETLLRLVRAAAAVQPGERVLDCYAGVGLFARGLAEDGGVVTAVEAHPAAAADARHNLAGHATVVEDDVAAVVAGWDARVDVVVLDPPRRGAGAAQVTAMAGLAARTIVYVACDPAALARDAAALRDAGYDLIEVVPVDQFAHTAHIEAVATFRAR